MSKFNLMVSTHKISRRLGFLCVVFLSIAVYSHSVPQPSKLIGYYPFSGHVNASGENNYNSTIHRGSNLTQDRFGNRNSADALEGVSIGKKRFKASGESLANTYTGSVDAVRIWKADLIGTEVSDLNNADNIALPAPTITDFNDVTKTYFDASYIIAAPTSNSSGTFTYASSDSEVATISGTTVTIVAAGTATITATQEADGTYSIGSISSTLTVNTVSIVTKNGELSTTNFNYVNKNGAVSTSSSVTIYGQAVSTKSNDGLTAASAGLSALQIKADFPSAVDGLYWITNPNINGGTPFQIYADMTTDGGGWMLLNVGAGNTAAPEVSTVTSPDVLGYLPRATVIGLAKVCTDVQLRAGASSTSYANKTTSTSPLAIGALQSTANVVNGAATWANGASSTFVVNSGSWFWAYCCPGSAAGWPKMYHSSNYTNGVHWFADAGTGRKHSNPRDAWFSTWIR